MGTLEQEALYEFIVRLQQEPIKNWDTTLIIGETVRANDAAKQYESQPVADVRNPEQPFSSTRKHWI
jgi:hypothetical protein